MSNEVNHIIVTKKIIYEAKAVSIPTKETRDVLIRAGLSYGKGQWDSYHGESVLMTEDDARAFFAKLAPGQA